MKTITLTPDVKVIDRMVGVGDIVEIKAKFLITDEFKLRDGKIEFEVHIGTSREDFEPTDEFIRRSVKLITEQTTDVV